MINSHNLRIHFLPVGAGDCMLLQFNDARFNILIDAGPKGAKPKNERLCQTLLELVPGGVIDLAIVTHHDDDHIGGFFYLLSEASGLTIKDMIFNSTLVVDKLIKGEALSDISPRQARQLSAARPTFNQRVVCAGHRVKVFNDLVELIFLSPCESEVLKYGVSTAVELTPPVNISVRRPFRPYAQLQGEPDTFIEDKSKPNLLSLAFEVRFNGQAWLFLGDAWPSRVHSALDHLYPDSIPQYELVKVSHHGSNGNTTAELIGRLSCSRYVFLADGRQHPHEEVFRRIIQACDGETPLFFFPEKTAYLEGLLHQYSDNVVYPGESLLNFYYGAVHESDT